MKIRVLVSALAALCGASAIQAEDGILSAGKLNKLGLASMSVASDSQGMAVRGTGGDFVKAAFNWRTATGEKAIFVNGQYVPVNPPRFAINDTNSGSAIATDGGGINVDGPVRPVLMGIQSSSRHQQDYLMNGFVASEVSSARLAATIVAGNPKSLGIVNLKP